MNDEEKREAEVFVKKGMSWDDAKRLVRLTKAKAGGQINPNDEQQLTNLQTLLSLILPCST